MRKAAGVLLVVFGLLSIYMPYQLLERMVLLRSDSIQEFSSTMLDINPLAMDASAVAMVVVVCGGGVCTLRRKFFLWSMIGALFLVVVGIATFIFGGPLMMGGLVPVLVGVLSTVFLRKTRDDFQS